MSTPWIYTFASVLLVSLISLIGILTITLKDEKLKEITFIMVSMAAGGLFGDSFIHLLPESYRKIEPAWQASLYVLIGIFTFFVLEKFLHWRHSHGAEDEKHVHPMGYMNLLADGVHNFIDGMLIGASYLVSIKVGIATTIAVILHEIPQEIGDFGVLLHSGFSKARALFLNFASALLSIAGALIALLIGTDIEKFGVIMVPIAAGGFIYIAGSDLIPELHKEIKPHKSFVQLIGMGVGAGVMFLLILIE